MINLRFKGELYGQAVSTLAFDQFYSEVLRGSILSLLTLDVSKRMTCGNLRVMLEKHANSVVAKENFVVDNAPPRLHEEIQNLRQQLGGPQILNQSAMMQSSLPQSMINSKPATLILHPESIEQQIQQAALEAENSPSKGSAGSPQKDSPSKP